jgi:hypothetical protein
MWLETNKKLRYYKAMSNKFKAPIKVIKSSWRSESFKKPSSRGVIVSRSLYGNSNTLTKVDGTYVSKGNMFSGNMY